MNQITLFEKRMLDEYKDSILNLAIGQRRGYTVVDERFPLSDSFSGYVKRLSETEFRFNATVVISLNYIKNFICRKK